VTGFRWRPLAALTLLLPVPLLLLLGGQWLGTLAPPEPRHEKLVPMLSQEQRLQRQTWHQPCQRGEDCEPPLACFFDTRALGLYCTDSSCLMDRDCREDFTCATVETWGGELLRRCILEGARQEGDACRRLSQKREQACARGLLCDQWCGRPCRPEKPGSCPEGFFCPPDRGPAGSSCLPTCEERGCPPGQSCVRFDNGSSVCAVVHGPPCQQTPCPEEQFCATHTVPGVAGKVWMRCEASCSTQGPPCPEGSFCFGDRCLRTCDLETPGHCGPGEKCAKLRDSSLAVCLVDTSP
jgi:hypothetical protein